MKKLDLGQTIGIIANLGVVGGLIFLGVEIQQNTNATRADAIQQATNVAREQLYVYAQDPDLMRLAMTDFDELNELDQRRRLNLSRSFYFGMQNLFRQWEMGVLPDADWDVWYGIICRNRAEVHPEIWSEQADLYPGFLRAVESCSDDQLNKPARD